MLTDNTKFQRLNQNSSMAQIPGFEGRKNSEGTLDFKARAQSGYLLPYSKKDSNKQPSHHFGINQLGAGKRELKIKISRPSTTTGFYKNDTLKQGHKGSDKTQLDGGLLKPFSSKARLKSFSK